MKQFIISFFFLMIFLSGIQCIYTMESRQVHKEELELVMEKAMRHSLRADKILEQYEIADDRELYADFLGEFMLMASAEAEYDVQVHQCDAKRGILDIEIQSDFSVPGGRRMKVSCRKYACVWELY